MAAYFYQPPLSSDKTAPLKKWFEANKDKPYPNKSEKIEMSIMTNMAVSQVSTWFANARRKMKLNPEGSLSPDEKKSTARKRPMTDRDSSPPTDPSFSGIDSLSSASNSSITPEDRPESPKEKKRKLKKNRISEAPAQKANYVESLADTNSRLVLAARGKVCSPYTKESKGEKGRETQPPPLPIQQLIPSNNFAGVSYLPFNGGLGYDYLRAPFMGYPVLYQNLPFHPQYSYPQGYPYIDKTAQNYSVPSSTFTTNRLYQTPIATPSPSQLRSAASQKSSPSTQYTLIPSGLISPPMSGVSKSTSPASTAETYQDAAIDLTLSSKSTPALSNSLVISEVETESPLEVVLSPPVSPSCTPTLENAAAHSLPKKRKAWSVEEILK